MSRLLGAPPGYVGYEEGGMLSEAVRRKPFQLVLFDEFEKAHRDVSNVLLQVLDEGRLTDSQGYTVDFRNTVIIMTTNLGSDALATAPQTDNGAVDSKTRAQVTAEMRRHLSPEFLNRIDEVVLFNRLSREAMVDIVDVQVRGVWLVVCGEDKACKLLT